MLTPRNAVALFLLLASAPVAASVDSLTLTTATWKRTDAHVAFGGRRVVLTLAFEKVLPAPAKPKPSEEGFEGDETGPRITAELTYSKEPGDGSAGNVPGLDGAADSSAWSDDVVLGQPAFEAPPDIPLPRQRVLTARVGSVSYRVTGSSATSELVPLLKALLTGDPVLYRVRRQYPREIEVAGPKPPVTLYKGDDKTDYFTVDRPEQLSDLEYSTDAKTPVIFHFKMRQDELSFDKKAMSVISGALEKPVRVLLRCAKIGLYADTDAKGVAEFDLGLQTTPGEWRFQASGGAPSGADWQLATAGRAIVRIAGKKEIPDVSAPGSESPAVVAEALARAVEKAGGSGSPLPPELVSALFGQPQESRPELPWKADAFWLERARGNKAGPVVETSKWLDGLRAETYEKWVTRRADAPAVPKGQGWTEAQAEKMLSLLRQYELSTDPTRLVEARKEAAKIFPLVLANPDPETSRGDAPGAVSAHAMMGLALFKANDIFRETSYRRMAFDQVAHLLEQHLGKDDGSLRSGKTTVTDLRAAGLVAQLLRKAWRSSSKPVYKAALAAVRKRVFKSWSTPAGGFLAEGSKKKADLGAQFWALTAFTDSFFPYWDLPGRGWLD